MQDPIVVPEINELGEVAEKDVSQPRPKLPMSNPYSRKQQRKMVAQFKRSLHPKRGTTKPLHDKEKSRAINKQQRASRRINRLSRQALKTRV